MRSSARAIIGASNDPNTGGNAAGLDRRMPLITVWTLAAAWRSAFFRLDGRDLRLELIGEVVGVTWSR